MCRYHIDAKTCCCTVLLIWNGLFWDVMLLHFTSNYPTYLNKTPVCAAFILKGMLRCFRSCAGEPWAARRACSRMWLASTTRRRQRGGATRPVFKDTGRPGALNPLTPAGSRAAAEHRPAARRTGPRQEASAQASLPDEWKQWTKYWKHLSVWHNSKLQLTEMITQLNEHRSTHMEGFRCT